ncbi:MAG TPA: twin-arginine translocase TatA/TatE family subunit [Blastocatellia bacterium]|jgi:TatA/E family protein of Tat protein translocase|nr:twin-arginine translocase TatA/TatE family subunit [Blastocatellia bacterium]
MGSLGWPEILIILVIALIIFGPRKLPELGKTLGSSLAQFRRASEDFKRTWEDEVEMEKRRLEPPPPETVEYTSSSDPYEGQDFNLEGNYGGSTDDSGTSETTDSDTGEVADNGTVLASSDSDSPADDSQNPAPAVANDERVEEAKGGPA